jgi:hypothetical protein
MRRARNPGVLLGAAWALVAVHALAAQPDSSLTREVPTPVVVRPADWETLSTGLPEEARFRPVFGLRYNRVDGPAPTVGAAFQTGRSPAPVLFAQGTYAYSRKRPLYEAGFTVPFGDRPQFSLGGVVYRRTATEDDWIVTPAENTLFAMVARTDYQDDYEAQGGRVNATWSPGSDFELRGGARIETQRSLSTRTRISLTGRHPVFRPNTPIKDGDEQALTLGIRIGPAEVPLRGGLHGEAQYERSGDPLQGDFEYGRARGALRYKASLAPTRDFRARLVAGSTLTGTLPAQKLWYVGGIGTLRGHDFKSSAGDQFFVVNAELYQRARKNLYVFSFLDCGAAWFGSDNLSRQKPGLDAGFGVRIAQGPAAVTIAKNLRDGDSKPRVGVRLGDTF